MRQLLSLFVLLTSLTSYAQKARVTKYTAPLAGTVILKDVEDKYNAQVYNMESPSPDAGIERKRLYEVKAEVGKMFPYKRLNSHNKTTAVTPPVVTTNFVADSFTGVPPDNDMAISKGNKAVSVVNSNIAVSDASLGQMTYKRSLKTFSLGVGLNNINDYRYDPKIIYDPEADKFICVMLNNTDAANYIVVGFSKSNDPAGQWNFYKFYGDYKADTTWFDYPCIAITKDEFFLTGNKIKFATSWQTGFRETVIYQISKQSGYNGDASITYQVWDGINNGSVFIRNLYPVKGGSAIGGPAQYFLSNRNFDAQNDTIFLVKVPDVISSGNHNLDIKVLISPTKYGVPPDGRQPDTSATLATNDGRILGAFADANEIQFVSASVTPGTGASGIFHGRITDYQNAPVINHAQIYSIDTLDFGYPNITYSGNPWGLRQAIISFNYTGPNMYPGMGAILFNGLEYSPMTQVKTGLGSIKVLSGKQQRWGDYMGAQIEWGNVGSVWVEGIYGRADKNYGNWMAKLNSPILGVKNEDSKVHNTKLYPNPAIDILQFEFEMDKTNGVKFVIYDMWGRMVDKLIETKCKKGLNRVQFNAAPLTAGTYILSATTIDGEEILKQQFVKQ